MSKSDTGWQYSCNGKDRPASQNRLSALAFYSTRGMVDYDRHQDRCCVLSGNREDRLSMNSLWGLLFNNGINLEDPTLTEWDFKLPNGNIIAGRKVNHA